MKPIAIIQHSSLVGPGHFASFLEARKLPFRVIAVHRGDAVPGSAADFSGLCLLGGEMSVNDGHAWIDAELALIRAAMEAGIPVIGHCLGGQLMSRALGGSVTRNPVPEIGWSRVRVHCSEAARRWLGETDAFDAFQWHRETFSLPANAEPLFSSEFCANQAFALGPHLGMQCHVEMTADLVRSWVSNWHENLASADAPQASVQTRPEVLEALETRLAAMHRVSERLYAHWLTGVLARVQAC